MIDSTSNAVRPLSSSSVKRTDGRSSATVAQKFFQENDRSWSVGQWPE
jgi:hypothetical protein